MRRVKPAATESRSEPAAADALSPSEVIHDGRWSRVGRLQTPLGDSYIRKISKYELRTEDMAVVEFLHSLATHPHPNLLIPHRFSGETGTPLVEEYPDLSDQARLDKIDHELRSRLAKGKLNLRQIVDFIDRLSDAVGYIHRAGYVHQDVRARNVFVRAEGDRLIPTLFDYTFIVRPFFLENGRPVADLEAPPEVRVGYITLDHRYDVYQLGWLLRKLTHYEAAPDLWRPMTTDAEDLQAVIARATSTLARRYLTADDFRHDLDRLTG